MTKRKASALSLGNGDATNLGNNNSKGGGGSGGNNSSGGGKLNDSTQPTLLYREGEPLVGLEAYVVQQNGASPGGGDDKQQQNAAAATTLGDGGDNNNSNNNSCSGGQLVEVRVPIECLSASNRQVHARQLWGAGPYMGDSDIVACILHSGAASAPVSSSNNSYFAAAQNPTTTTGALASTSVLHINEIIAVVQPLPAQRYYKSATAHGIRSRAWGQCAPPPTSTTTTSSRNKAAAAAASDDDDVANKETATQFAFNVLYCYVVVSRRSSDKNGGGDEGEARRILLPRAPLEPPSIATFFAANQERVVHTRSRASERDSHAAGADKRHRASQEVTVQYNLLNEPWLKYCLGAVADRGWKRHQWLSSRMIEEVLYLETDSDRYEIARNGPATANGDEAMAAGGDDANAAAADAAATGATADTYRVCRCKVPLLSNAENRRAGVPLSDSKVEVVHAAVTWEELQWAVGGLHLRGKLYAAARMHFARRKPPSLDAPPQEAQNQLGLALADAAFLGEMD